MERKMTSPKNKTPFRLPLRVYLSYLLVFTLIFTAVSFAKFATSGGSGDGARVASFSVSAVSNGTSSFSLGFEKDDALSSSKDTTFDDTAQVAQYAVAVRNYDDTGVSEVALSYDIIISVAGGLPEGISLKIDGHDPVSSADGKYTFSGFSALPAGTATEYSNILTITAVSKNITTDISNLQLDVSVYFEQID